MSSYSASIAISNGALTVTRPHPSVEAVDALVDDLVYAVRNSDTVTGVSLSVTTSDDAQPTAGQPAVPDTSGNAADPLAGKTAAPAAKP